MRAGLDDLVGVIRRRNDAIALRQWHRFEKSYRAQVLNARGGESEDEGRLRHLQQIRGAFLDEVLPKQLGTVNGRDPQALPKIVFLLGAGTSASAGVPLARTVVEECSDAIGEQTLRAEVSRMRKTFAQEDRAEAAWSRYLLDQQGEGEFSFEEVLSAYRYLVGEPELLELMRSRFRVGENDTHRSLITLFNECLAHLCREQLADFIVSLNFDELLERSLDEDIGRDGYVPVIDDARFQWASQYGLVRTGEEYTDPQQRQAKGGCERARPWLLKPHGTISHEATLCHLAERVYRLGPGKEAVLKDVFEDSYLVVVGYGLTALDFHRILMSHALTGSITRLLWVDPGAAPGRMGQRLAEVLGTSREDGKPRFMHVRMTADDFARELLERLYPANDSDAGASASSDVRKAGMLHPYRHFLRAAVFQRPSPGDSLVHCTFQNRFIVECVALAVRMKGWWSSRMLAKSHQIQHLLRQATQNQRDGLSNLPELLSPFFVSFPRKDRSERIYILRRVIDTKNPPSEVDRVLLGRVQQCLPDRESRKAQPDLASVARQMGFRMASHPDVAIYSDFDELGTIRHAVRIHSTPVLRGLTDWLLEKPDNLYVVTETGTYLTSRPSKSTPSANPPYACLMLGDYERLLKEVEQTFPQGATDFYIDDIEKSAQAVRALLKLAHGVGRVVDTFKKRYHFTLWHDSRAKRVAGIVYTRIDRQPGATFYWVELDQKHPADKHQFKAWRRYAKSGQASGGGQPG